jgi:hypothetical protein
VIADQVDRVLAISTLAVATATSVFAAYIAFVSLRFTAAPKVSIQLLKPRADDEEFRFPAGSHQTLRFVISNIGRWYAHPPATRVHMYISFSVGCVPTKVRYGSAQELTSDEVKLGKLERLYVEASGISVVYGEEQGEEQGEEFHVEVTMPLVAGVQKCFIAAFCGDGIGLGFHEFPFDVRA